MADALTPFTPHLAAEISSVSSRRTLGALAIVALVLPYTVLNVAASEPFVRYAAGLVLAHLALGMLSWAGLRRELGGARSVLGRPVSWQRAAFLAIGFAAYVVFVIALLLDRGRPADWVWVVLYAPASAIAQELYFRGRLLASLDALLPDTPDAAVTLQAGLFAIWHAPRAFLEAHLLVAALFVAGSFIAGVFWGNLVRRQSSLAGSILTHTIVLVGWDALLIVQGQPIH